MKTNLFFLTIVNVLTFSIFAGSFNSTYASAPTKDRAMTKSEITVTDQIRKYIQINNIDVTNLKTGIVVVSFSVDENNELLNVVSHSKIRSLDRYLQSCLEGKTLLMKKGDLEHHRQQFVKIRFNID